MSNDPRWVWRLAVAFVFFAAAFLSHFVFPGEPALALADSIGAAAIATAGLMCGDKPSLSLGGQVAYSKHLTAPV